MVADIPYTIGDRYALQGFATEEEELVDRCQSVAQYDRTKVDTTTERGLTQMFQTIGKGDLLQRYAVIEDHVIYPLQCGR